MKIGLGRGLHLVWIWGRGQFILSMQAGHNLCPPPLPMNNERSLNWHMHDFNTLIFFYKKPVVTFLTYDIEMILLHPKHRNYVVFTSQCKKLEYSPPSQVSYKKK